MTEIDDAEKLWKPLPLPKKDCTFQGVCHKTCCDSCSRGRVICDAVGDDVSLEFCHLCRYLSKGLCKPPSDVAIGLSRAINIQNFPYIDLE